MPACGINLSVSVGSWQRLHGRVAGPTCALLRHRGKSCASTAVFTSDSRCWPARRLQRAARAVATANAWCPLARRHPRACYQQVTVMGQRRRPGLRCLAPSRDGAAGGAFWIELLLEPELACLGWAWLRQNSIFIVCQMR